MFCYNVYIDRPNKTFASLKNKGTNTMDKNDKSDRCFDGSVFQTHQIKSILERKFFAHSLTF